MEFSIFETALVSILMLVTLAIFSRDALGKIRIMRAGRRDFERTDQLGRRLATTLKEVLLQTRTISGRPLVGLMHAAVFGGFLFFALETLDHFGKAYGLHVMSALLGDGGMAIYKGIVALWAVLVSVGIVGLAFRRFVLVKISPDPRSVSSGIVALFILGLMLTFLYGQTDPQPPLAKVNWWLHAGLILGFPPLILRSKHFHLVLAPFDIFFRSHRTAELAPLELDLEVLEAAEQEPYLGLEKLGDVSWKQRMDFFTCVECRRCTDNCPANLSGQELDPRGFILAGRRAIRELGDGEPVIGQVLSEKALGQCTTCGACEAACPVGIEHLQVLIGAKQAQAMATGVGMVAAEMLKTIERSGNPFAAPRDARTQLIEELGIPIFTPGETEVLLWLGCVWAYNTDARSSLEAMVKILASAGVRYGVLRQESCSGHHSRRQGEEMQFQTLARENLERLQGVETIVAPCPHCLHTLAREYPDLDEGFRPRVMHHSELIEELVAKGALRLDPRTREGQTATYHDPCYLGRFEGVYQPPRSVIRGSGLKVLEMERHGARSMCCGGGGGGFAREIEHVPARVDQRRKEQVQATGARLLVTACPECKMMLNAAVEETKDLAELVAESLA